jgi:hypothetical protein
MKMIMSFTIFPIPPEFDDFPVANLASQCYMMSVPIGL